MRAKSLVFTLTLLTSCLETKEKKEVKVENQDTTNSIDSINIEYRINDTLDVYLNNFFPNWYPNDDDKNKISKKDSIFYVEQILKILNTENINKIDALKSEDGNILIFSQEQETGGSASVENHILAYKTKTKGYKLLIPFFEGEDNINISGANIESIYNLPSKNKNLYLLIGGGIGNNSFNYSLASVIELKNETINFDYSAFEFKGSTYIKNYLTKKSSFTIDYSNSNYVLENVVFNYDSVKKQLIYKYPYYSYSDTGQEKEVWISKKLKFNGKNFNGFVY